MHIQRKSGLEKGGTVKSRDLKEETKRFLSEFMGFVSSGNNVAPSWLMTFGTFLFRSVFLDMLDVIIQFCKHVMFLYKKRPFRSIKLTFC